MALPETALPFGMRDMKIYTLTGETPSATGIDLPNMQTLGFADTEDVTELRGDDGVVAVHGNGSSVNWNISAGGLNLEALAALNGGTVVEAGTTPNIIQTYSKKSTDARPYVQIKGQAISDSGGDVVVTLMRAKASGDFTGEFTDAAFFITGLSGRAVPQDSDDLVYTFAFRETSAALS